MLVILNEMFVFNIMLSKILFIFTLFTFPLSLSQQLSLFVFDKNDIQLYNHGAI